MTVRLRTSERVQRLPDPHPWLRSVTVARVPGPSTPLVDGFLDRVEAKLTELGHRVLHDPSEVDEGDGTLDAFVSTAKLHEPRRWRDSMLFVGRKRFGLSHSPPLYTFVQLPTRELAELEERFRAILAKPGPPDPADYALPGLAPKCCEVLCDQGRRGGPMMSIARMLQGQTKSLRVVGLVGDEQVEAAYVFDLAGSYPRAEAIDPDWLATNLALRMVTALSTREVTDHEVVGEPVSRAQWEELPTREAMLRFSRQLGEQGFFTRMVHVADLVDVPAITNAVAAQYSEGCFATWEPALEGMLVTATGSQHPVVKDSLSDDDLAVIVALRPGGEGARVRLVEGLRNVPPSSEAVEMRGMDLGLPEVPWEGRRVPVVRSKLHGHRGISAYDPARVEFVPLGEAFHHYPVSCSTEAQAHAVMEAFARSEALRNPEDPRQVVFTILPCHGLVMVEKWVEGRAPFDVLGEAMQTGGLDVAAPVPQGPFRYEPREGRAVLVDG